MLPLLEDVGKAVGAENALHLHACIGFPQNAITCPLHCIPIPLLQAQAAQAALMQLAEEREAVVIEKDAAVQRVAELQDQVEQLRAHSQEARAVGTPHGARFGH